jgi:hypothetical protein
MKPAVTIPYSCLLRAQSAKLIQADSRDYGEGPSTAKMRNVAYFSPIASVALRAGESHHACALSKLSYCVTTTRPALGHWRDCDKLRCQRARRCLLPHPCYWNRKQQMSEAEQAQARKLCEPLLKLMAIGSSQGSDGLWLF